MNKANTLHETLEVKALVQNGQLMPALDCAQELFLNNTAKYNFLVLLKSQFRRLTNEKNLSLINEHYFHQEINRIEKSLIDLLEEEKPNLAAPRYKSHGIKAKSVILIFLCGILLCGIYESYLDTRDRSYQDTQERMTDQDEKYWLIRRDFHEYEYQVSTNKEKHFLQENLDKANSIHRKVIESIRTNNPDSEEYYRGKMRLLAFSVDSSLNEARAEKQICTECTTSDKSDQNADKLMDCSALENQSLEIKQADLEIKPKDKPSHSGGGGFSKNLMTKHGLEYIVMPRETMLY